MSEIYSFFLGRLNRVMKQYFGFQYMFRCIPIGVLVYVAVLGSQATAIADDPASAAVSELVNKAVAAAGGEEKLLTLFRMEERFNSGKEPVSPGTSRVSVVQPPNSWWIGTKERGREPAKFTVWAWTLGMLNDPMSKLTIIPDVTDNERTLAGVQVTGSVDPAMDLYFDKATHELVRVDWRNDVYRFSNWQDFDGTKYPSKCAMFRRKSGEPWFFHEIVSIERLPELPEGLKP